jgi:hypothetical protein
MCEGDVAFSQGVMPTGLITVTCPVNMTPGQHVKLQHVLHGILKKQGGTGDQVAMIPPGIAPGGKFQVELQSGILTWFAAIPG